VTATIDSGRASKLIRGHTIGKEVKHYYMRNPDNYSPEQFGWHPKLEVSFQTSVTDETIYWDRENAPDLEQCRRELDETLMNVLDWAGLDVLGGDEYHEDAYFDPESRSRRSLKLVDCPLPEIESEQENAVMRLWGDMNGSDRALTELLLHGRRRSLTERCGREDRLLLPDGPASGRPARRLRPSHLR